jgi:hypothetical protein
MRWNDDCHKLAVWNMEDGIDVYELNHGPVRTSRITMKIIRNFTIQLSFLDEGTLAVGSDRGVVFVVDIAKRRIVRQLNHESYRKLVFTMGWTWYSRGIGGNLVQVVTVCCQLGDVPPRAHDHTDLSADVGDWRAGVSHCERGIGGWKDGLGSSMGHRRSTFLFLFRRH